MHRGVKAVKVSKVQKVSTKSSQNERKKPRFVERIIRYTVIAVVMVLVLLQRPPDLQEIVSSDPDNPDPQPSEATKQGFLAFRRRRLNFIFSFPHKQL